MMWEVQGQDVCTGRDTDLFIYRQLRDEMYIPNDGLHNDLLDVFPYSVGVNPHGLQVTPQCLQTPKTRARNHSS